MDQGKFNKEPSSNNERIGAERAAMANEIKGYVEAGKYAEALEYIRLVRGSYADRQTRDILAQRDTKQTDEEISFLDELRNTVLASQKEKGSK